MTRAENLLVDLIIAVHDSDRPLERAIRSVLASGLKNGEELRITVVCHNIGKAAIADRLSPEVRTAVRLLQLKDGIASAAGPFNHGIAAADARYVSIMGSDDYLEPRALGAWLDLAERESLAAVIAPERHASGRMVRTPPVRPRRWTSLDPVKDRLSYRTAPIGLLRRETIERLSLRFPPGLKTGEDQYFSAMLWFSGESIGYARRAPKYVVGDDARTRTTLLPRPVAEELRFIDELIASSWFVSLPDIARTVLATKMVRVHVFSVISRWLERDAWSDYEREELGGLLCRLAERAPQYAMSLSIADRRLLDAIADSDIESARLRSLAAARRKFGTPTTVFTRRIGSLFAPDAPIRFMASSALL